MQHTILICDDDSDILAVLEIYLVNEGYQVLRAENGLQALQIIAGQLQPVEQEAVPSGLPMPPLHKQPMPILHNQPMPISPDPSSATSTGPSATTLPDPSASTPPELIPQPARRFIWLFWTS